ncbi:hypothetical protein [Nonomuraea basaltis]|uniref:hypothetical protein n=1 Tax=Nonomuraea basaltis TaxID=2495887 RepID=UPI00110C4D68|nr:hypothetical protein [Nonomuraea basaltis]TMR93714.1 hypothetical protein EJK15_37975 [Nonomuraea basaltis]
MISASAAVAAAVSVAEEHGVRVREPVVLKDSFNLRIHLRPAPIVARVPTVTALGRPRPADVLRRELDVVSYLHGVGVPVVPPSELLPPGPHLRDGVVVTFWAYVEHDPAYEVSPEEAGRALAELHEAMRGFPGELPYLGPVLDEPATMLDGRAAVRAYGADPDDPGLRDFLAARGLQGTLWMLVRALRFPAEAGTARTALDAWLRDPSGATR